MCQGLHSSIVNKFDFSQRCMPDGLPKDSVVAAANTSNEQAPARLGPCLCLHHCVAALLQLSSAVHDQVPLVHRIVPWCHLATLVRMHTCVLASLLTGVTGMLVAKDV